MNKPSLRSAKTLERFDMTDPWKDKCLTTWEMLNSHRDGWVKSLNNNKLEIGPLIEMCATLEIVKSTEPKIEKDLQEIIDKHKKRIFGCELRNTNLNKSIVDINQSIQFFKDHICPHEETTYDHSDYHKNDEYFKCNLCEKII